MKFHGHLSLYSFIGLFGSKQHRGLVISVPLSKVGPKDDKPQKNIKGLVQILILLEAINILKYLKVFEMTYKL